MEKSPKRARINFLIYYEVDGDTSNSLQSSTYGRSAGTKSGCSSHPPAP